LLFGAQAFFCINELKRLEIMAKYTAKLHKWAQQQVKFLKERQFDKLDIDNLVKEIEALAINPKNSDSCVAKNCDGADQLSPIQELEKRLSLSLTYLLKMKHLPAKRKRSWTVMFQEQRKECLQILNDHPELEAQLEDILSAAYDLAKAKAVKKTRLSVKVFDAICPWTFDDIKNDNFSLSNNEHDE
jgi:hypothetical protein